MSYAQFVEFEKQNNVNAHYEISTSNETFVEFNEMIDAK